MKPRNLKVKVIAGTKGFVTNDDEIQQSDDFARDCRGFRFDIPEMIAQRDWGTIQRYAAMPTTKNPLTNVPNVNGATMFDQSTGKEHAILLGYDQNPAATKLARVNVDTSLDETGTWKDLTRVVLTKIATLNSYSIDVLESATYEENANFTAVDDEFNGWIAFNKTRFDAGQYTKTCLYVTDTQINTPDASHTRLSVSRLLTYNSLALWVAGDDVLLFKSHYALMHYTAVATNRFGLDFGTDFLACFNPIEAQRKVNIHVSKNVSGVYTGQTPMRVQKCDARKRFYAEPANDLIVSATGSPVSPIVINTLGPSKLVTTDRVYISGATGNTAMNGEFRVVRNSDTQFQLVNIDDSPTTGNGTYNASSGRMQSYRFLVASASNAGPIVIGTNEEHIFSTGDIVKVESVGGNTNANGVFTITVVDSTHFSLNNSVGNSNYTSGGTVLRYVAGYTHPADWYAEEIKHTALFQRIGSAATLIASGTTRVVNVHDGDPNFVWLKMSATVSDVTKIERDSSAVRYLFFYVIPIYDGYQKGDPIIQFYAASTTGTSPKVVLSFYLGPAKMNQHCTGVEIYATNISEGEWAGGLNEPADSEYKLAKTIDFTTVNAGVDSTPLDFDPTAVDDFSFLYIYSLTVAIGEWDYTWKDLNAAFKRLGMTVEPNATITTTVLQRGQALAAPPAGASIVDFLGHAVLKNRTYFSPRFAVRGLRQQGALNIVDADNNTLAVSAYGGSGAHMDDVYVNSTIDNQGAKQRIYLNSRGEILGMFVNGMTVAVIKPSEIEIIDLGTGSQDIYPADASNRQSIVWTRKGGVWAGQRGIYILPIYGIQGFSPRPQLLNAQWVNLYDGREKTDDGTEIVTDTYRSQVVAGADSNNDLLIFQVQRNLTSSTSEYVCACYNLTDEKWWQRKFNIPSKILAFAQKNDKTISLIYSAGVLKYPNKTGTLRFEDCVTSAGVSSVLGVETLVKINMGFLADIPQGGIVYEIVIDCEGESTTGYELFQMKLYPDNDAYVLDPCGIPIDAQASDRPIRVEKIGKVGNMYLELRLPAGTEYKYRDWKISTITVWYLEAVVRPA